MPVTKVTAQEPRTEKRTYQRSKYRFPYYSLADSLLVAKAVGERGGGVARSDQLAAFLDYKSANNGAFFLRISAAKMFGLVASDGGLMRPTSRATAILSPTYPQDAQRGLAEAFLAVPLYQAIYDETRNRELPPGLGMKNLLRNQFGVGPSNVDTALRVFMASAEQAGFFSIRGSRTHLIMPTIAAGRSGDVGTDEHRVSPPAEHGGADGGSGESGAVHTFSAVPQTREELQNAYVAALIDLLREQGRRGDVDPALMARIEKLLALSGAADQAGQSA